MAADDFGRGRDCRTDTAVPGPAAPADRQDGQGPLPPPAPDEVTAAATTTGAPAHKDGPQARAETTIDPRDVRHMDVEIQVVVSASALTYTVILRPKVDPGQRHAAAA